MNLPKPNCKLGYTSEQVKAIMGERLPEFQKWGRGSTGAICDGLTFDFDSSSYLHNGCGPHGLITYRRDVERFLEGLRQDD